MFKLRRGFIIGGLVGAAAAMAFARKRPEATDRMTAALSKACSSLTGMAVSGWMNRTWNKAANSVPKPSSDTTARSEENWGKIEAILNTDPALKKEVSRIQEEAARPH